MVGWKPILIATAALLALEACGDRLPDDRTLAAEIEAKVAATRPDIKLARHARFYAHEPDGSVKGVWVYGDEDSDAILDVGRTGEIVWTKPEDLPIVYDAGCMVIIVAYDTKTHRLRYVACDGDGDLAE